MLQIIAVSELEKVVSVAADRTDKKPYVLTKRDITVDSTELSKQAKG